MTDRHIPDDFPREPDPGAVSAVQPKLPVREVDGRYQSALTDDELWVRYDACEDLAAQLAGYVSRKIATSGLTPGVALGRAEKGVKLKVDAGEWELSQREVAWVMKRTRELLPTNGRIVERSGGAMPPVDRSSATGTASTIAACATPLNPVLSLPVFQHSHLTNILCF